MFALFVATLLAANGAQAHNRITHERAQQATQTVTAASMDAVGEFTAGRAASLTAQRDADRRDDSGCAHGPLHVFCVAGATCCVAPNESGFAPVAAHSRVTNTPADTSIAGLAPPPLDRPPR